MLRYSGMSSVPGAPGNLMAGLDLPFGGGQQYRQIQQENRPSILYGASVRTDLSRISK